LRLKADYLKKFVFSGFLAPLIGYSFIFIAIANAPWFSWEKNALSDLGAHAGSDIIFNSGLMISGILLILFSIGLFLYFEDYLSKIGASVLILDGIALFGIGLFPETTGTLHLYFSIAFFVLFPIGYIILSIAFYLKDYNRKLSFLALTGAILAIIIWATPWNSFGITGVAIPEFLSSLVCSAWVIAMSFDMYGKLTKSSQL